MTVRARIAAVATAVPEQVLHQEDVAARAAEIFAPDVPDFDRFATAYRNAAVATRHSCVPISWYSERHTFAERNALYLEHTVALLEQAAARSLAAAGLAPADIDTLVVVSTTGIATPSLDALLLERMAFRRDLQRLPVFGLGCAGGVGGLARAAQLAVGRPTTTVLLLVVELCGLTFRVNDTSKSNIIATALFGDGAAGAVLGCAVDGAAVVDWGEHTWPHSLDVMGWRVADDGLGVLFARDIPNLVRTRYGAAARAFLARQGLSLDDIDGHVCHPGGAKVLDALEQVYGLAPDALATPRAVLRDFGNMSAATVFFILERMLADGATGRLLMAALGPGFSASFALLEAA